MAVSLSIIIATLGRPSLDDTIMSIVRQLGPDDEVLIASRDRMVSLRTPASERWRFVHTDVPPAYGGANERQAAMAYARGTHLCFIDDDDIYTPDALDHFREHAALDRPVIFRMDSTNLGIGPLIWREPVLRYANVSTATFLVPNIPDQLGHWEAYERGRGCDFTFISGTVEKMGPPVFRHEVVAVCRPALVVV